MLIWLVCLDDTLLPTKEIIPKPEEKEAWISEKSLLLAYKNFFRKLSSYQMQNAGSTELKHRLFFYHYKPLSPDTLSVFIETFQQNSIFFRISPVINLTDSDKNNFRMEIKKRLHFKLKIKTFHETGGSSDSSGSSSSASTPKRTDSLACSRRGSTEEATSLDKRASIGISPLATITLLASTGRKLNALGIDSSTLGKSRISKIVLDDTDLPDIHDYFVIDSDLEITQPITKLKISELNPSWVAVNPRFQYLASLLIQMAEKI